LSNLEHDVVERSAVGLHHPAGDLDRLARRLLPFDAGEVVGALRELAREERPQGHLAGGDQALHGIEGAALRPRTTS
jgi:hypothetical protein